MEAGGFFKEVRGLILYISRVFYYSYRRFEQDGGYIRANAIAYSIIISVIPALTVFIKYASVDLITIRMNLGRFFASYGIMETGQIFTILEEIISRANTIAGIGSLFMIYAATNMMNHLEESFSYIYRAEKERPIIYRFSLYISALVIFPGLFFLSAGTMKYYMERLTPPVIVDTAVTPGGYILISNQGILRNFRTMPETGHDKTSLSGTIRKIDLEGRIDKQVPFRTMTLNLMRPEVRTGSWIPLDEASRIGSDRRSIEPRDFVSISASSANSSRIHIISESGAHFESRDEGVSWTHHIFAVKTGSAFRSAILEDVTVTADNTLFILANAGSISVLISRTPDGTWKWKALDSIYRKFAVHSGLEDKSIYILGNSRYILSNDAGRTWNPPVQEQFGDKTFQINSVSLNELTGEKIFAGNGGVLWKRSGESFRFPEIRANQDQHVLNVTIYEDGTGFLYGENGLFRFTADGGDSWLIPENPVLSQISFYSHITDDNGDILLFGEEDSRLRIRTPVISGEPDSDGLPRVTFEIVQHESYPELFSILFKSLLYLILFLILFSGFFPAYKFLPNAHVEWKAAAAGAAFTAFILLVFFLGFRTWVAAFANTRYIYGAWAVIPVGMIVVLFSNQILLFGLELSYVIQYPYVYLDRKSRKNETNDYLFWYSLEILLLTYRCLLKEKRPFSEKDMRSAFSKTLPHARRARDWLTSRKLISYNKSAGEYYPVHSANEIRISDLQSWIIGPLLKLPPDISEPKLRKLHGELESALYNKKNRSLTVKDLI